MAGAVSTRGRRARRVSGDERERAILETAERLLAERGVHDISVDDLARGAGISRPAFYFYFASKDAVLLTLLDRVVEEARASRDSALEQIAADPERGWRSAMAATIEAFRAHRPVMIAAADAAVASPDIRTAWSAVMEAFVRDVAAVIEAERARGAAPPGVPARDLAIALNAMNERVLHATFTGYEPAIGEDGVDDVLAAIWIRAVYGH
jgi:AcrR family transcriptional regulator